MGKDLVEELRSLPPIFAGLDKLSDDLVYLLGCRSFEQFCSTLRALLDPEKFCPFCQYTAERDIRGDGPDAPWHLRMNDFPPKRAVVQEMLLIVPRKHLTDDKQLSPSDWSYIGELCEYAHRRLGLPGGALVLRFGNPRHHAGTVPHLHFNIISPTGDEEYRVALSKNRADRVKNYARLLEHREELTQRGGLPWLFSEEGIAARE